jgi:tRNA(adenine34) deaminase
MQAHSVKDSNSIHSNFMTMAINEASKAYALGEIPCGCVIVRNGIVLSSAHNTNRTDHDPTRHAELAAIEKASRSIQNERLLECDLYVTKEPCAMCAGAIIHARIARVFIGSGDEKYGACGTKFDILGNEGFNHRPEIYFGVMEDECTALIKRFFSELREQKKRARK